MRVDTRVAGWAVLAAGLASVIATVLLLGSFALEAPAAVEGGKVTILGPLSLANDTLLGVVYGLLIPVAVYLARSRPEPIARAAAAIGLGGLTLSAGHQFLFVSGAIEAGGAQPLLSGAGLMLVGIWLVLVTAFGAAGSEFGVGARRAGVLSGLGHLSLGFIAISIGPAAVEDPQSLLSSPLLVALFMVGLLLANFATPVWAFLAARRWLAAGPAAG